MWDLHHPQRSGRMKPSAVHHQSTMRSCADDEDFATVSVDLVVKTIGKQGKAKDKTRALVRHLLVGPILRKAFVERAQRPAAAAAAPAPALA